MFLGPLEVPVIGFGAMGCTAFYNADPAATEAASLAAIAEYVAACAPGKAFVDTAWIYAHPSGAHNETLVGKAIAAHGRDAFIIATKCGIRADFQTDSSEAAVREQLAASLARLGVSCIDLYYQHRADAATPPAALAATMAALIREGSVRHYGLSECTPAELRAAHAVAPVAAVQLELSLQTRDAEAALIPACRELGVGVVAYSPLGRGLLAGAFAARADLAETDWRRRAPRFSEANLATNAAHAAALAALAARHGATPAQLALAWALRRGACPIPGSKSAARVRENVAAAALAARLSEAELDEAAAAVPEAVGERYEAMHGTFNLRL